MILYKVFFAIGMLARAFMDFFEQQEDAFMSGYSLEIAFDSDGEGENPEPE